MKFIDIRFISLRFIDINFIKFKKHLSGKSNLFAYLLIYKINRHKIYQLKTHRHKIYQFKIHRQKFYQV